MWCSNRGRCSFLLEMRRAGGRYAARVSGVSATSDAALCTSSQGSAASANAGRSVVCVWRVSDSQRAAWNVLLSRSDHLRSASRAKMNTFRDYCTTCLTDHLTPPYIQAHSLLRILPASSSLRDYDRRSELARTIAVNTLSLARSQCCCARMAPPARPHRRPHLLAARTRLDSCT